MGSAEVLASVDIVALRLSEAGELQLLLGPQRVEGGWWDRDEASGHTRHAVRDYWVAASAPAGLLWVFQTRLAEEPAWFLHGFFA